MARLLCYLALLSTAACREDGNTFGGASSHLANTCIKCNSHLCKVISSAHADSAEKCCSLAQATPGCEFWTFSHKQSRCFLKQGNYSHHVQGNCDSGVLNEPMAKCSGARFSDSCISCDGKTCQDFNDVPATSADVCCSACRQKTTCAFWTFNSSTSTCYMKKGSPIVRTKDSTKVCQSGILEPNPSSPQPSPKPPAPSGVKNILLFIVDDLRPDIGAYGASFMHTPSMDKLAATGVLFQRAYIQYSFCAPSRNSFMTGRRPDSTKSYSFMDHFREPGVGSEWKSMPQYFRELGYLTLGAGKIFHAGLPPSFDAAKSWDYFTSPGMCNYSTNGWPVLEDNIINVACPSATGDCPTGKALMENGTHWCKVDTSQLDFPLEDDITANVTIRYLQRAKEEGKPFFIAAGYHKPHMPFTFPAEFDIYPLAHEIKPPLHPDPPKDMPRCAWHEGNFDNAWGKPCDHSGEYRRAYYSAVSYTDSLIGKVLDALEHLGLANDTAVALMGDHGWHLGEMNLWRKMTNFELDVRVPLVFRVPWAQITGAKTPALVEAVDLFPTLVELAGLPPATSEKLEGSSLAKIIAKPPSSGTGFKKYAFSQFAKASHYSKELGKQELWNDCSTCNRNDIEVMGFSIRSDDWRLTEWVRWNAQEWAPLWDDLVALELYNHTGDFGTDLDQATPTANVAADPLHTDVVKELRAALRNQFQHAEDEDQNQNRLRNQFQHAVDEDQDQKHAVVEQYV